MLRTVKLMSVWYWSALSTPEITSDCPAFTCMQHVCVIPAAPLWNVHGWASMTASAGSCRASCSACRAP